jgi:hypothetical protein
MEADPANKERGLAIGSYLTPYKYGKPVIGPSGMDGTFNQYAADNMRIFRHRGRVYCMTIGFDGIGYQTALAVSDDLLHWTDLGVVLPRGSRNLWDRVGRAISCVLHDVDLYGNRELIKKDGKYWLFYHAYPEPGYETGGAANGLAWTTDEELLDWHFLDEPVFTKGAEGQWDGAGLYSVWCVPYKDSFRLYYNGKSNPTWPWKEQVGLAMATDNSLRHWERYAGNPIHRVSLAGWDSVFACGQHVLWDSRLQQWVQFFCGFDGRHAQDGVSISADGIRWRRHPEPIIPVGAPGDLDSVHAHKPCVIWHEDTLYHFYCAVRPSTAEEKPMFGKEYRCLTVAASRPFKE